MIEQFMRLIQKMGEFLTRLNETFYFYVDIETSISWAIILIMYLLYKLIDKYYSDDQKLTSDELIKLLAIYLLTLLIIMASYTDFGVILRNSNPEYSFFMITGAAILLVLVLAWGGATKNKKNWILFALYVPITLLVLTNGEIIEQRLDSFRALLPRTNLSFINLPGEVDKLRVGGDVTESQVRRVEALMNSHRAVLESALVGYRDTDGLVKPYALVVLNEGYTRNDPLKNEIKRYVEDQIEDSRITEEMYPYYIEFIDRNKLPRSTGGGVYSRQIERILNEHEAVYKSSVSKEDGKIVAYVAPQDGYRGSRELGRLLMDHILAGVGQYNTLSNYMEPRWVSFLDRGELPRVSSGGIDHRKLQKMIKNWSVVFPGAPTDNPFERDKR